MDCWLEVEEKTPTARLMGGGFDGIDGMGWDRIGWMESGCGTRAAALQGEHEPMLTPKHLRLPACSRKRVGGWTTSRRLGCLTSGVYSVLRTAERAVSYKG